MLARGGIFTNPIECTPTYTSVSFRRLSNYTIKHLSNYTIKHLSNYTNVFYFLKGRLEYTLSEKIFFRTPLVYLKTFFETCFEHTFSKRFKMSICQFLNGGLLFFIVLIVYPLQPL